ncbi:MAG: DNA polymerase III subunit gamma/tau [Dehalococcoidia bacterium]
MGTQVFYRKWRPQKFADLVGQDHVTRTLLNALAAGRVAHAYLFCGSRGTGKTSMGRILAKAVNCMEAGNGEPCGQCGFCTAVAGGHAMDLIEIDAASNRGIDEIRSLREKVNFSPNEARYKVYIIDEVHMLTKEAFNALLKTLEEPPPHTIFVLATTEAHKLPATVISRCQRFDFRRIPLPVVVERLARICEDEGVQATPDALTAIARSAGGSLRDAENILEQAVVGQGQQISRDHINQMLGIGGEAQVRALTSAALRGHVGVGLAAIGEAAGEGLDLAQFHRSLMEHLRGLLLVKAGAGESVDLPVEDLEELRHLAAEVSMERILRTVRAFGQADLRGPSQSPLSLELALVEAAAEPDGAASPAPTPAMPEARPASQPPAIARPAVAPSPPVAAPPPTPPGPAVAPQPPPEATEAPVAVNGDTPSSDDELFQKLKANWRAVIEASKGQGSKYKLDALLRSGRPDSVHGDAAVVAFTHRKFVDMMNEVLEDPVSRKALEEAVEKALGKRLQVRCIVAAREQRPSGGHLVQAAVEEMGARIVEGGGPGNE